MLETLVENNVDGSTYFDLDLVINSSEDVNGTILSPTAKIAGVVHHRTTTPLAGLIEHVYGDSPIVGKRVQFVPLCSLFRQRNVASRNSMAASPHHSGFANTKGLAIRVYNVDSVVRRGLSNCQSVPWLVQMHGVNDGSLCGAAAVIVGCMRGPQVGKSE